MGWYFGERVTCYLIFNGTCLKEEDFRMNKSSCRNKGHKISQCCDKGQEGAVFAVCLETWSCLESMVSR